MARGVGGDIPGKAFRGGGAPVDVLGDPSRAAAPTATTPTATSTRRDAHSTADAEVAAALAAEAAASRQPRPPSGRARPDAADPAARAGTPSGPHPEMDEEATKALRAAQSSGRFEVKARGWQRLPARVEDFLLMHGGALIGPHCITECVYCA